MKREIKFRAWDKQNNCWYKPTHEAYKGMLHDLMVGMRGQLLAHTINGVEHESLWPDRFELVQFTGLLDKNGKEIYEGDILAWSWLPQENVVVYYNSDEVCFVGRPTNQLKETESWLDSSCEVIGNIYENPELL